MSAALLEDLKSHLASCDAGSAQQIRAQAERIEGALGESIAVWQEFLDSGRTSDDRFTAVLWLGAKASKALFAQHLEARAAATELSGLTELPFSDLMGMAEEISVVMAYDALQEGETVPERAEAAITTMSGRRQAILDALAA